jgi:O-antigen/teichoic acid export membrane protein
MEGLNTQKDQAVLTQVKNLLQEPWQIIRELRNGERIELPRLWNSIALIFGRMASSGLGFLTWIVTARLYAADQVGIASGIVAAMMLCVQLALIGVGSALINKYPEYAREPARLVNTALNLLVISTLTGAGLFMLLASTKFQELNVVAGSLSYILYFTGITVFGTLNVLMDHVSIAMRRNDQVFVRNVLFGVVTMAAVWVVPLIGGSWGSKSIIAAWTLAGLSACSLGYYQLSKSVPNYRYVPNVEPEMGKRLIMTGFPNYLLTIAERAPNWVLPILVIELLSPTQNAHWYTVWMIAWVVFIVPISIGQNLFAEVSRKPEQMAVSVRHSLRTSLLLGSLAAVVVIGLPQLPLALLGPGYVTAGTTPLRILVLAVIPVSFIQAYFGICRGTGRLWEAIVVGLISGAVGIGLAAVAGMEYGLPGMATAWLVTQTATGGWAGVRLRILSVKSAETSAGKY